MARDLVLEIGVEELPSAYMTKALADLRFLAEKKLSEARLSYDNLKVLGTPRRLTIIAEAMAEMQGDANIETRGPKKASAFDADGNPSKAGLGFARGQGVDLNNWRSGTARAWSMSSRSKRKRGSPLPRFYRCFTGSYPLTALPQVNALGILLDPFCPAHSLAGGPVTVMIS